MKKALGQTVRDLKRGMNKKVLKVPGIEQKILDATSNEPWGPHGSVLADLAQATRNYQDHKMIMNVVWRRINDTGKNWRHVYKALTVLEYLVAHGSDRIIDEIREHAHQLSTLSNFQYIDSGGRDQGGNVRRKSQSLVALVNDREKLKEVRQKATSNKDKFQSPISASNASRPGYGDRYGNEYRDDDQNSNGRERDYGYKDDEKYGKGRNSYSQDGDQYGRDHEERYGRDAYKDDDYQLESRGSVDRYTERSVDDDDRHSSRSGGGRGDDHSHDDRWPEHHLYEENDGAPPRYEESTKDVQSNSQNGRDGEAVAVPADRSSSGTAPKTTSATTTTSQDHVVSADSVATSNEEFNGFDEFDPRGSLPAQPSASNPDLDFFGSLAALDSPNSLALMLAPGTATSEADMPTNSGFGMDFASPLAASTEWSQGDGNPFGDSPFKATPQENIQSQSQNFAPADSFGSAEPFSTLAPHMETSPAFDFGDMLGGLTYPQHAANDQHSAFSAPEMPFGLANSDVLDGILPRTGSETLTSSHTSQPAAPTYMQTTMFPPQVDPISLQAGQSAAPNSMQAGHLTFPPQGVPMSASLQSQPEVPNNMQSAHLNFFQQLPSQGAPVSSQTAEFGTGNNMQLAQPEHLNFLQPGLSASALSPSVPPSFSSQVACPAVPGNIQSTQLSPQQPGESVSLVPQTGPTTAFAAPPKVQSTKFQPKSTVWADTLNRGLVDFNISGAKVNPLSDIGIDFESINRMEKRKEVKSSATPVTSTVTMGKAMGAGSGIGRAGATGIAPPPNSMMGTSIGMGGGAAMGMTPGMGGGAVMGMTPGIGMGMGMGMGNAVMRMGMNQPPMGMGMATGPGAQMWPPNGMPALGPGMAGVGYNPMMGMGNYGSQQSYGGTPPQQQFGGGYR